MYLLDSDILISLTRGQHHIQEKISETGLSRCLISEITLAELYVGAYKRGDSKTKGRVDFIADNFTSVPISGAIQTYAKLRTQLELEGNVLDNMDLFIAATALAGDYTLVSHNTKHFSRIPGLKLEDWIVG